MKIEALNQQNIGQIEHALKAAFDEVGAQFGVKIEFGNGTYSESQLKSKLIVTVLGDHSNAAEAKHKESLKQYGYKYGIDEADYNKLLTLRGKSYRLRGIRPKASKYPIIAESQADGKNYCLPSICLP